MYATRTGVASQPDTRQAVVSWDKYIVRHICPYVTTVPWTLDGISPRLTRPQIAKVNLEKRNGDPNRADP